MIELAWLDWVGWVGFAGLIAFYWRLGSGHVLSAYIFSMLGTSAWLVVGIATEMGYAAELPSLIGTEVAIILMNVRGIIKWRRERERGDELAAAVMAGLVLQDQLRSLESILGEELEDDDNWTRVDAEHTLARIKQRLEIEG